MRDVCDPTWTCSRVSKSTGRQRCPLRFTASNTDRPFSTPMPTAWGQYPRSRSASTARPGGSSVTLTTFNAVDPSRRHTTKPPAPPAAAETHPCILTSAKHSPLIRHSRTHPFAAVETSKSEDGIGTTALTKEVCPRQKEWITRVLSALEIRTFSSLSPVIKNLLCPSTAARVTIAKWLKATRGASSLPTSSSMTSPKRSPRWT
mmetsp:Transcript_68075/g.181119  ORF Transcript_68075/g.181119 Transcript_68075/m.181119 type:complete len:204 (-) Transcript_68075:327-938(-)